MKFIVGREYLCHWKSNPSTWNENLEDLKRKGLVEFHKGRWYTKVTAHFTGDFYVVDCTTDDKGNSSPINEANLKPF